MRDLTPGNQLRSQAQDRLSKVQQIASSARLLASSEDPSTRQKSLEALRTAQDLKESLIIEQRIMTLIPKQMTMLEKFWDDRQLGKEDYKYQTWVNIGGNRSGKSYGACTAFCKFLRDQSPDEAIFWCITPNDEKSIGQQKMLWDCIPHRHFDREWTEANGFSGKHSTVVLTFETHKVILKFKTETQFETNPRSFEQEPIHGAWIDESMATAPWEALKTRGVDHNAFFIFSCIPDQGWMADAFEEAVEGDGVYYCKFDMRDNPILSKRAIELAIRDMDEDEKQMRVFGDFRYKTGLVYKEFLKEYSPKGHLCRPFQIPKTWPRYRGFDYGYSDPTVCLWLAVAPNDTIFVYKEHYLKKTVISEHAETILAESKDAFYPPPVCDPSMFNIQGDGTTLADQYRKYGIPMVPAPRCNTRFLFDSSVSKVRDLLVSRDRLGPKLQVFDTITMLTKEFRVWKFKTDKTGKPIPKEPYEKGNDHALDALRYVVMTNPSHTLQPYDVVSPLEHA